MDSEDVTTFFWCSPDFGRKIGRHAVHFYGLVSRCSLRNTGLAKSFNIRTLDIPTKIKRYINNFKNHFC